LKLFAFAKNWAFVTSSNVTKRGLGLVEPGNREVGCRTPLSQPDWIAINALMGESYLVTEAMYNQAVAFRDEHDQPSSDLPALNILPSDPLPFSRLCLPATESPQEFCDLYTGGADIPDDVVPAFMHDLALYGVEPGAPKDTVERTLRDGFIKQPFTQAIVSLVKRERAARFGLVNQWIQESCSDQPTPYRWELKPATRRLYNWLDFFYEEISWDRPHHSMILRWSSTGPA